MSAVEYGIRDARGDTWPAATGRTYFRDEACYIRPSDDEEEALAHIATHPGTALLRRVVSDVEVVKPVVPLPTTPGSVVEKDGVFYGLTNDEDSMPWTRLSGDDYDMSYVRAEALIGAEVRFDAGASK